MRTRILIGLFTVLMLGASCTTAQNSKETFYDKVLSLNLDDEMLRDDGTTLKIAKLAPQQFRLRVCKGDKLLFVTWVELRAVERYAAEKCDELKQDIAEFYSDECR